MIKIVNKILSILKMFLLLMSFVFSCFILVRMYQRLEKDMFDVIFNFIPFICLFILFSVNFVLKQKSVNECLFYNICCCLVFSMILLVVYRTLCDKNMIALLRLGHDINFNYFSDIVAPMRAMMYMLCISNILLIVDGINFSKLVAPPVEEKPKPKRKKTQIELKTAK